MDLAKPSRDIGFDQLYGLFHRRLCGFILPAVWPQMVAAQNQAFLWKTDFLSDFEDKVTEVSRFHAGITAELVYLIRGGLNQDFIVCLQIEAQGGLNHQRVG